MAKGHWGKLPTLKYAKNDFLCLRATLLSTKDGGGAGITLGKDNATHLINLFLIMLMLTPRVIPIIVILIVGGFDLDCYCNKRT